MTQSLGGRRRVFISCRGDYAVGKSTFLATVFRELQSMESWLRVGVDLAEVAAPLTARCAEVAPWRDLAIPSAAVHETVEIASVRDLPSTERLLAVLRAHGGDPRPGAAPLQHVEPPAAEFTLDGPARPADTPTFWIKGSTQPRLSSRPLTVRQTFRINLIRRLRKYLTVSPTASRASRNGAVPPHKSIAASTGHLSIRAPGAGGTSSDPIRTDPEPRHALRPPPRSEPGRPDHRSLRPADTARASRGTTHHRPSPQAGRARSPIASCAVVRAAGSVVRPPVDGRRTSLALSRGCPAPLALGHPS